MSRKNIEDMFEIEGMEELEDYTDYEEDDEEGSSLELEKGDIIELTGENGEEKPFAVLDIIEYEHCVYMILMDADEDQDEDEAQEVVILEGKEDPEDPDTLSFEPVEDDLTTRAIFAVFRERNRDEYNFVDSE